jgi:hypothetical protein
MRTTLITLHATSKHELTSARAQDADTHQLAAGSIVEIRVNFLVAAFLQPTNVRQLSRAHESISLCLHLASFPCFFLSFPSVTRISLNGL